MPNHYVAFTDPNMAIVLTDQKGYRAQAMILNIAWKRKNSTCPVAHKYVICSLREFQKADDLIETMAAMFDFAGVVRAVMFNTD